jgi:hypothetical protein
MKKFIKGSTVNQYCWGFDLDKFDDFGFRSISDEQWKQSLYADGDVNGKLLPSTEWTDPRRGELFKIVEALLADDVS